MKTQRHYPVPGSRQLISILAAILLTACGHGDPPGGQAGSPPPPTTSTASVAPFVESPLVSDGSIPAKVTDANLKNPWGIVFGAGTVVWVANNATQTSTLYEGTGLKQGAAGVPAPLVVAIPAGMGGPADITGIVANSSTTDFKISKGVLSGPPRFIFAGEGGTITAWSPEVDKLNALTAYDDGAGGAVYKGLAIASNGTANFLYATDFHNNKVDVFDLNYHKVTTTGGFIDSSLPSGYAPFGIQAFSTNGQTQIYVTYAQQVPGSMDNANGKGLGLVNVFDVRGALLKHLIPVGGALNAPWGVALAPDKFGPAAGKILIGNFGSGNIEVYDPATGADAGPLSDALNQPLKIDGLWGIAFGNGAHNQPTTTLYFAAGTGGETGGLYGRIDSGASAPDVTAPTVSLTAPADGSTINGTVALTANATDDKGVAKVEFFAGTTSLGSVGTAPFTISVDTTKLANGPLALTVQATDAGGNATTSAVVNVTVANSAQVAATLTQLQANIFTPICSVCHSGANPPAGLNLSDAATTYSLLVGVKSTEMPNVLRVSAGNPDSSYIVLKLEKPDGDPAIAGLSRMPRGGPYLPQATIDQVRAWIAAGAQNN
jgi:uncharacterized protein (TIGR03118 family)